MIELTCAGRQDAPSVIIVTKLWAGQLRNGSSILGKNKLFLSSPQTLDRFGGLHNLPSNLYLRLFQEVKRPEHEADHSTYF